MLGTALIWDDRFMVLPKIRRHANNLAPTDRKTFSQMRDIKLISQSRP